MAAEERHDAVVPRGRPRGVVHARGGKGEDPLAVARREFEEELGSPAPAGGVIELGELVQPSRKQITAYAIEGDFDPSSLKSNRFEMEWPPKSGTMQSFPEVDRAEWFTPDEARIKILPGQRPFIDRLLKRLGALTS